MLVHLKKAGHGNGQSQKRPVTEMRFFSMTIFSGHGSLGHRVTGHWVTGSRKRPVMGHGSRVTRSRVTGHGVAGHGNEIFSMTIFSGHGSQGHRVTEKASHENEIRFQLHFFRVTGHKVTGSRLTSHESWGHRSQVTGHTNKHIFFAMKIFSGHTRFSSLSS
jgi:hypothetical protein